ncbi:hypothetical protein GGQ66_003267 [Rhizobium borbori]|uniref:Uncharacterized protein n=1 Tax=Allorhizobium borbori TaxID=485907 RepID=A0A7W6K3T5_9HYPH|nr:hypothetical protein [Allorhizobium borbori]
MLAALLRTHFICIQTRKYVARVASTVQSDVESRSQNGSVATEAAKVLWRC